MRVRVLKRVAIIAGIVLFVFAAVVAGIVIKQVYFPYYRNYSTDYAEAVYTIEGYEKDEVMTAETIIRVSKEKPKIKEGALCPESVSGMEFHYIFENTDPNILKIDMTDVQCKMIFFTVYFKDGSPRSGFTLYSKDWNKGCGVVGTDITFKTV